MRGGDASEEKHVVGLVRCRNGGNAGVGEYRSCVRDGCGAAGGRIPAPGVVFILLGFVGAVQCVLMCCWSGCSC